MNRELKFRAYGCFGSDKQKRMIWDWENSEYIENVEFDGEGFFHVMQFTGLKDKDGKEIYESDIVEVENTPEGEEKNDVITVCKWDNGCWVLEDGAGGHWTRQLFHKPHRLTVLGNIYETNIIDWYCQSCKLFIEQTTNYLPDYPDDADLDHNKNCPEGSTMTMTAKCAVCHQVLDIIDKKFCEHIHE